MGLDQAESNFDDHLGKGRRVFENDSVDIANIELPDLKHEQNLNTTQNFNDLVQAENIRY